MGELKVGDAAIMCAHRSLRHSRWELCLGASGRLLWCEMIAFYVAPRCTDHRRGTDLVVTQPVRIRRTAEAPNWLPKGPKVQGLMWLRGSYMCCGWVRTQLVQVLLWYKKKVKNMGQTRRWKWNRGKRSYQPGTSLVPEENVPPVWERVEEWRRIKSKCFTFLIITSAWIRSHMQALIYYF